VQSRINDGLDMVQLTHKNHITLQWSMSKVRVVKDTWITTTCCPNQFGW